MTNEAIIAELRRLQLEVSRLASAVLSNARATELETEAERAAMNDVRMDFIKRRVAANFALSVDLLTCKRRPDYIAWPRQIAMYLCREFTDATLDVIGAAFHRDHGTVNHAVGVVIDRIACNSKEQMLVFGLRAELTAAFAEQKEAA